MAQGLNRVTIIGNLGADPELKFTQSGQAVMRLRIAVNERWKDKGGETKERVEWFTVVMWGNRAEALNKHLTKGQSVYVEGRLQTRKWDDKDGNARYSTEVVATDLLFLGGKGDGGQRQERRGEGSRAQQSKRDDFGRNDDFPPDDFGDDDIPF